MSSVLLQRLSVTWGRNQQVARPQRRAGIAKFLNLTCWAVLLFIGLSGATSLINFSRSAAAQETFGFSAYYTAARLALAGEVNGSLQDWDWFRAQTRRYGFKATDVFYGNPPSAALLMTPIAHLSPPRAREVWIWMTLAFWLSGILLLGFTVTKLSGGSRLLALPALLCAATLYAPVRANIEEGQVYTLAFFLQSLCCSLWLRGRPATAGITAGTLLAGKAYGLPLIALAMLRGDRRFVTGAAGAFTSLAIVAEAMVGFRQWTDFFVIHWRG